MGKGMRSSGLWQGMVPAQYIYANRAFKRVVLDPPDFDPGSWIGAGKALFDHQTGTFLLTARPRRAAGGVRGFAANIYGSGDGEEFTLVTSISQDEVSACCGLKVHSIEGTQLLRDPLTGRWHLYLSVDAGTDFIWGGLYWQTLLLTSTNLTGPWRAEGLVLRNDQAYDANQARDASIDIIDGEWICVYKAMDSERTQRPALATSLDGIAWRKHGPLTIDGTDQPAFLNGSMFAGTNGPVFMGVGRLDWSVPERVTYADEYRIGHADGPPRDFVAYRLDLRNLNLETIFRAPWEPLSPHEHREHPLLGYGSLVFDPIQNRVLIYVEAIDGDLTKEIGLNETVERLLLYETKL